MGAAAHAALVALLYGHPDDWWRWHDWDLWWSQLAAGDRDRLLDLGWGGEPAPLLGIVLASLRGAVYEDAEEETVFVQASRPSATSGSAARRTSSSCG